MSIMPSRDKVLDGSCMLLPRQNRRHPSLERKAESELSHDWWGLVRLRWRSADVPRFEGLSFLGRDPEGSWKLFAFARTWPPPQG